MGHVGLGNECGLSSDVGGGRMRPGEKGAVFGNHLSASQCFISGNKRGSDDPFFCQQLIPAKVLIAH